MKKIEEVADANNNTVISPDGVLTENEDSVKNFIRPTPPPGQETFEEGDFFCKKCKKIKKLRLVKTEFEDLKKNGTIHEAGGCNGEVVFLTQQLKAELIRTGIIPAPVVNEILQEISDKIKYEGKRISAVKKELFEKYKYCTNDYRKAIDLYEEKSKKTKHLKEELHVNDFIKELEKDNEGIKFKKFDDIVGHQGVKDDYLLTVKSWILPQHRNKYSIHEVDIEAGIIYYGLKGTGKSTIALSIKKELESLGIKANVIYLRTHRLMSGQVSEVSKKIDSFFTYIRRYEGFIILVLDEVDGLFKSKDDKSLNLEKTNEFLRQYSGQFQNISFFTIATTNLPWNIDDNLIRSGKFRTVYIKPPTESEIKDLIEKKILNDKFDIDFITPKDKVLVTLTKYMYETHFTGSDIEQVVRELIRLQVKMEEKEEGRNEWKLTTKDIADIASKVEPRHNIKDTIEKLEKWGKTVSQSQSSKVTGTSIDDE